MKVMLPLILMICSTPAFSHKTSCAPSCTIETDAYDARHPRGCVLAIMNEFREILGPCFAPNQAEEIARYFELLVRTGQCREKH